MTTWHTPDTARALRDLWPDVEQLEDETLALLLDVAKDQVIAYAPALPPYVPAAPPASLLSDPEGDGIFDAPGEAGDGGTFVITPYTEPNPEQIPDRYALAQFTQAKNTWNAGRVDANGGIGDGGDFVMRPMPLDWHVKQILRPKRGRPRVR